MDKFKLRIRFTGLFLFVPDRRDPNNPKLHVLMPTTDHHGGHHHAHHAMDPHKAVVYGRGLHPKGEEMIRHTLDLHHLVSADQLRLPPELYTMPHKPRTQLLDEAPGGALHARVTLSGGRIVDTTPGAFWVVAESKAACEDTSNSPVEMTHELIWESDDIPGTDLDWRFNGPTPKPPRGPAAMGGRVNLRIMHAPHDDHRWVDENGEDRRNQPPLRIPDPCSMAEHFPALYELLPDAASRPVPWFREVRREKGRPADVPPPGGSVYTCMGAQTPPVP